MFSALMMMAEVSQTRTLVTPLIVYYFWMQQLVAKVKRTLIEERRFSLLVLFLITIGCREILARKKHIRQLLQRF